MTQPDPGTLYTTLGIPGIKGALEMTILKYQIRQILLTKLAKGSYEAPASPIQWFVGDGIRDAQKIAQQE